MINQSSESFIIVIIFKAMNYLAHAYLSFNKPDILAGNIISDFVKGKKKFDKRESLKEKDTKREMDRAMKKYR